VKKVRARAGGVPKKEKPTGKGGPILPLDEVEGRAEKSPRRLSDGIYEN